MSDTVRPRAMEPLTLLGRNSITLQLIVMQRLIGNTMHSLSAMETGQRTQKALALVQ